MESRARSVLRYFFGLVYVVYLSPQAYHQYGRALLSWSRMEGEVFEHAMSGFDLGES